MAAIYIIMPLSVIGSLNVDSTVLIVVDVYMAFTIEPTAQERLSNMQAIVDYACDAMLTLIFTRLVRRHAERNAPQAAYDVVPKTYRGNEPT